MTVLVPIPTPQPRGKGSAYMTETLAFATAFPLGPNGEPRIVTVSVFDAWAIKEGLISPGLNKPTMNSLRFGLRDRINICASSARWQREGERGFHIRSRNKGGDYIVQPTEDALAWKAFRLPDEIMKYGGTKVGTMTDMLNGFDINTLPAGHRDRLVYLFNHADGLLGDIKYFAEKLRLVQTTLVEEIEALPLPASRLLNGPKP